MGKPADPRIAEYAFVERYWVTPNAENRDGVLFHQVNIVYVLLDNAREKITEKTIDHNIISVSNNGKENMKKVNDLVYENIDKWIEQDKKDMTGYYPLVMIAGNKSQGEK